jgi:hypothetical protein
MKKVLSLVVLLSSTHLFAGYVPPLGQGQSETWTGAAGDGNWATAQNWSGKVLPSATIGAYIPGGSTINVDGASTANWIETTGSGSVLINGGGTLQIAGLATTNGASLSFGCNLVPAAMLHSVGDFAIANGGTFTLSYPWTGSGDVTVQAGATMTLQGSNNSPHMPIDGNLINQGTVSIIDCPLTVSSNFVQDGTLTVSNGYATAGTWTTGGTINLQGSQAIGNGSWTVTGATTINFLTATNRFTIPNSYGQPWTGTVSIEGWVDYPNNRLQVGNNAYGLSVDQLNDITFQNVDGQARNAYLSAYGYITPNTNALQPAFTFSNQPPAEVNVAYDGNLELSVSTSRPSSTKYQWQLNGTNLDDITPNYIKRGVTGAADGNYDCVVTSDNLVMTSTVANVVVGPRIEKGPIPLRARGNDMFEFTVSAVGGEPLQYQWLLNGDAISGATNSSHGSATAQPTDAGLYSVIVSNRAGSVTSGKATLVVLPYFTVEPTNSYALTGNDVTLTCTAIAPSGGGPLSCTWYFNGWSHPATANSETDDGTTRTIVSTFAYKELKTPTSIHAWVRNNDGGTNSQEVDATPGTQYPLNVTILSPASNVTLTNPPSVTVSATATTPNLGAVVTNISYYTGGTLIGTGSFATLTSPAIGSHTVTVVAEDSFGTKTTNAVTFTVVNYDMTPPLVSLSAPEYVAVGTTNGIAVTVTANSDESIQSAGLLVNGAQVASTNASGTNGLYTLKWSPTNSGMFTLAATATTTHGAVGTSTNAYVFAYVAAAPLVTLSPPSGSLTNATSITLSATAVAESTGASITNIELFDGSTDLRNASTVTLNNPTGTHTYTAVASDTYGVTGSNSSVIQFVSVPAGDLLPPLVALSAPVQEVEYLPITISGNVQLQGSGSLSNVTLLVNDTPVANTAPSGNSYSFSWTPATVGSYSLIVVVYTATGTAGQSAPATFTATNYAAPTVTLTSPATNGTVTAGNIQMAANASDNEGQSITTTFYIDGVAVGSATGNSPSAWNDYNSLEAGSHSAWAQTSDGFASACSQTNTFTLQGSQQQLLWSSYASGVTLNGSTAPQGGGEWSGQGWATSGQTLTANYTHQDVIYTAEYILGDIGLSTANNSFNSIVSFGGAGGNMWNEWYNLNAGTWSEGMDPFEDPYESGTQAVTLEISAANEARASVSFIGGPTIYSPWVTVTPGQVFYPAFECSYAVMLDGGCVCQSLPFTNTAPAVPVITFSGGATSNTFLNNATVQVAYSGVTDPDDGDIVQTLAIHQVLNGTDTVAASVIDPATSGTVTVLSPTLTAGTYTFYAVATDRVGTSTTNVGELTAVVLPTQPPTITLNTPTNGAVLPPGYPVAASVSASDPQGDALTVKYYVDGVAAATNTTSPYGANLILAAGSHNIYSTAYNGTETVYSATNTISAVAIAPIITLSPANNSSYSSGSVTFTASAVDQEGETLTNVTLYLQGSNVATTSGPTASYTTTMTNGTYTFFAKASDTTTSANSQTNTVTIQTEALNLLLLQFAGNAQDSSTFNWAPTASNITFVPNPAIASQSAKFNGSNSSLFFQVNTNIANQDFTVQTWVYPSILPTGTNLSVLYDSRPTADGPGYLEIALTNSGAVQLYSSDSAAVITSSTVLPTNSWSHVAVVRKAGLASVYVNGTLAGTNNYNYNLTNAYIHVGSRYDGNQELNGFLDQYEVVCGAALYLGNFVPPTNLANTHAPVLVLNNPSANITVASGSNVTLKATAYSVDPANSISNLQFWNGSTLLATIANPSGTTYALTWPVPQGYNSIYAVSYDNVRNMSQSQPSEIIMTNSSGEPAGVTNVALYPTWGGSVTATYDAAAAPLAFDGNNSTQWDEPASYNSYSLTRTWPVAVPIAGFSIYLAGTAESSCSIDVFNGTNWTDSVFSVTMNPNTETTFFLPGVEALTAIRLNAVNVYGDAWYTGVGEFKAWTSQNGNPQVSLYNPWYNTNVAAGTLINLQAYSLFSGSISNVAFYDGTTLLGTVSSNGPLAGWPWTVSAGIHNIYAITTDALGRTGQSGKFQVTTPPQITLLPANGAFVVSNALTALTASATDPAGLTLTNINLYLGGVKVATSAGGSSSNQLIYNTTLPAGTNLFYATASDNRGTGQSVTNSVISIPPPAVTLTAPTNGAYVQNGSNVTITATVPTGEYITNVGIYMGGSLLTNATTAPYTATWTASAGTFTVTAVAYDTIGISNSASVTITADASGGYVAPVVSLTSASGVISAGTYVISASAVDQVNQNIVGSALCINGTLVATNTGANVSLTTNLTVGQYNVYATASDNSGTGYSTTNVLGIPQTVLLLHMDGANGGHTFVDSSSFSNATSLYGSPTNSSSVTVVGGSMGIYGAAASGAENSLLVTYNSAFNWGTANFTIEAWVNATAWGYDSSPTYIIGDQGNTTGSTGWVLYVGANGEGVGFSSNCTNMFSSSTSLSLNTWYHVALTRSASVWRLFVNGILVASTTNNMAFPLKGGNSLWAVGNDGGYSGLNYQNFRGYIDELRAVADAALYTNNFTPPYGSLSTNALAPIVSLANPTNESGVSVGSQISLSANSYSPALGSQVTQVVFYDGSNVIATCTSPINGTNYSTSWQIPAGIHQISAVAYNSLGCSNQSATAQVVTLANYEVQYSGGNATASNSAVALDFSGTAKYTVEAWVNPTSYNVNPDHGSGIVSKFNKGIATQWEIFMSTNGYVYADREVAPWVATSSAPIPTNTYTHLAMVYDGSVLWLYVNGQVSGSTNMPSSATNVSTNVLVTIGANYYSNALGISTFPGRIDEVRIWNTNVSQATIQTWMNQAITINHPNYANLMAYYPFNEGFGTNSADASGHNYTAMLSGAYAWVLNTNSLWNYANGNDIATPLGSVSDGSQNSLAALVTGEQNLTVNSSQNAENAQGSISSAAAGNYQGLFYPTNGVTWASSGAIGLTVDGSNNFAGTLATKGQGYPIAGALDQYNAAQTTIARTNDTQLTLDFTITNSQLSGTVSDGSWTAVLQGEATAPGTNGPVSYVIFFNGTQAGAMVVSNNVSSLSATLPDGTGIEEESQMSATGQWPLYQSLYGGSGVFLGWMEWTPTNTTGTAVLLKAQQGGASQTIQITSDPQPAQQ